MPSRTRSLLALLASSLCAVGLVVAPPGADAAPKASAAPAALDDGARPATVPALQEWAPGGADFVLPEGAVHVEVDPRYAARLRTDARTLAADLRALTGREVVVDEQGYDLPTGPAAIRLTLDPQWDDHGAEAYRIDVDRDITVRGQTADGTFWGTRTVLQLLRQSPRVPGGTATDWPGYPERSVMVDNGRKYFSIAWAKRQIRELSYLKYNQFHWHLTDNAGFRIESTTHPEVVSPEHWTKEQVSELVDYAARYHVEVIPEIDMPGHMQYALRDHPELQVVDRDGDRYPRNLDPTNPAARQFVKDLLDELVPLFPGRYVHTGGDEFTGDWDAFPVLTEWAQDKYGPDANAHDAVLDFTNFVNAVVRSHGKTMRMWNDGAQGGSVLEADRDIVLEYWSSQHGGVLAQEFLDRGYRIVNANRTVLYDVPGSTASYNNLDPREIFEDWDMTQWMDWIGPNTTEPYADGVLGGQIHVWNDSPTAATEDQESWRLQTPLRAHIQQLWGSPPPGDTWDDLMPAVFAAGREPQWRTIDVPSGYEQDLALGVPAWASARERADCHPASLVDGDLRTRWCGPKTEPQTVVLDLGRPVDVGSVTLHWETAFASGYSVAVSDDLATWRPLYSTDSGDGGVDLLSVAGNGRYLRIAMDERGTKYGYSLWEVEVHAPGSLPPAAFQASVEPSVVLPTPGEPESATLTVSNDTDGPATVRWRAEPPSGVDVQPRLGALEVPAHGSADVRLSVQSSQVGNSTVPIEVVGRSGLDWVPLATADLLVSVPYDQVSDAYSNVSVTSDDDVAPPTLGDGFDGAGSSYSAQALAGEGVTPGSPLTAGNVTLHWPDVPVAQPNNVLANGQSFVLDGSGSSVGILAASTYGATTGDWVVHYADGSSQTFRLSTPDWSSAPPAGVNVIVSMDHRNNAGTGRTERRTQVFYQALPIDPDKAVTAVTLPVVSPTAVRGQPALHVFDLAIG